ncbi:Predicted dienelactone hydrolase [Cohaesibacter sp. ES.047]|uniref:alpha/beta hydrolase family protein n=1 Tax=Cohaesibacter sp. ES.047 TaxID=1798205 RepID=UPI000BB72F9D|nr:alpha/beta fold hydrolase [Cohaesibacter sp. ES.047]SNY91155.1 Predicted dienelactone hydrolase [Cohaesibacter sp. ES.047]
MFKLFISIAALISFVTVAQADSVGFRTVGIGGEGPRPLNVSLWYPSADTGLKSKVGETPAFIGVSVIRHAKPSAGAHPLVVLSHGYGGTWRNLSWLAEDLVSRGYAVAAPDHPGTTHFNRDPRQAAMLWERPHDLSRVIEALEEDPKLAGAIDPQRVAAIGHSLGGWSVTALAGARFDPDLLAKACTSYAQSRSCTVDDLGLSAPRLRQDMRDPRIRAFVSLDLGMAQGFTTESLADITIPALLIGAGTNIGDLPAEKETGWLGKKLPATSTQTHIIPDAMHFSFLQLCKPGAAAMIEAEDPGDGIVCRDGGDRSRDAIHTEVSGMVTEFLDRAMPPR